MTKKNKQKLELTWIGKEARPKLEPRILVEDTEKSYHADHRVTENDVFDNKLIFGDNLLALKALEQEYMGKIKCIYIDPPFNTGAAFDHYDDGVEHSIWLDLMYRRFKILHTLLSNDGVIAVHLDDNEAAYCKVILDDVFGRKNYRNNIVIKSNSSFGFKHTSGDIFKSTNHLLIYSKSDEFKFNEYFVEKPYDTAYKFYLSNRDDHYKKWSWKLIADIIAEKEGFENAREARKKINKQVFAGMIADFALKNASGVFRTASVTGGALKKRKDTIALSKSSKKEVFTHPNDDMDYHFIGGERVLFYDQRLKDINGKMLPAEVLTDFWSDFSWEGIAREGGVAFPKGKKPEALIKRVLDLCTSPGDLVLDSFGGSGTTGAVAHKMMRKWIMVELGEHCHTHIIPRIKNIISGEDQSGVSKDVDWQGGGGFRYYKIAPSMLQRDKWDRWIVSKEYNSEMLSEALCKMMGFTYAPSDKFYWMHGYSTEQDFIYITTQTMDRAQLTALSEEVGEDKTVLVCCSAFRAGENEFSNLTLKKIPHAVLKRCEWGKDDYSLNVENLPSAPEELDFDEPSLLEEAAG